MVLFFQLLDVYTDSKTPEPKEQNTIQHNKSVQIICMNGHVTRTFSRVVWTEIFSETPVWTRIVVIFKQKRTSVNVTLHLSGLGRFHATASHVSHISECNRCKLVGVFDLTRRYAGPREL